MVGGSRSRLPGRLPLPLGRPPARSPRPCRSDRSHGWRPGSTSPGGPRRYASGWASCSSGAPRWRRSRGNPDRRPVPGVGKLARGPAQREGMSLVLLAGAGAPRMVASPASTGNVSQERSVRAWDRSSSVRSLPWRRPDHSACQRDLHKRVWGHGRDKPCHAPSATGRTMSPSVPVVKRDACIQIRIGRATASVAAAYCSVAVECGRPPPAARRPTANCAAPPPV